MPAGPPSKHALKPSAPAQATTPPDMRESPDAFSEGAEGEGFGGLLDLPPPPQDDSDGLEVGRKYWHQTEQGNFCEVRCAKSS